MRIIAVMLSIRIVDNISQKNTVMQRKELKTTSAKGGNYSDVY